MNSIILSAIQNKKCLSFNYGGYHRTVEPHVYGTKDDKLAILCFQISGGGSSGKIPDWKRFELSKIQNLQMCDQTFAGRRDNPSGLHSSWDRIFCIVS